MKFVPIKVCWVWYAGEASGRGGLVWGGESVRVGERIVRKQENTENKIARKHESTTAYESIFDSNKLESVYLRGK